MTRPALYRPPDDPVYKFAWLVYKRGLLPNEAADRLKITRSAQHVMMTRLRDQAETETGRKLSDAMIYRLIVEPDAAQNDLTQDDVSVLT